MHHRFDFLIKLVRNEKFSLHRKIAGIKIFLHWTFPIIIFWIIFSNLRKGLNAEQVSWSVIFIIALFVCVTLHKLGHDMAARRYHIKTKDITVLNIPVN